MKFINTWYPVILAFGCLLYSVTYGILGMNEEAQILSTLARHYFIICNRN